jgi:hypothetical protein
MNYDTNIQNKELILAALNGKVLEWRYKPSGEWKQFRSAEAAIVWLAGNSEQHYEIRVQPVPDRVHYRNVLRNGEMRDRFDDRVSAAAARVADGRYFGGYIGEMKVVVDGEKNTIKSMEFTLDERR